MPANSQRQATGTVRLPFSSLKSGSYLNLRNHLLSSSYVMPSVHAGHRAGVAQAHLRLPGVALAGAYHADAGDLAGDLAGEIFERHRRSGAGKAEKAKERASIHTLPRFLQEGQ